MLYFNVLFKLYCALICNIISRKILHSVSQKLVVLPGISLHRVPLYFAQDSIYQYCLNKANSKAISLDYRENNVFRQTLSRISEPLKKEDTTTHKAFRILINESCTPNPSKVYLDVIYDIKSWIQPFPLLGTMDPLTFFVLTKKGKGEVELVYCLLPGDKQKEWLPKAFVPRSR